MALDNVVGQILESANKEADTLIHEAEKERTSILKQADEQVATKQKVEQKDLEQTLVRMRQQELSSAELEAKRVTLNAKKQVLDNTFQSTLKELGSLGPEDKARIYQRILVKGVATIPNAKVYCPKGDSKYVTGTAGIKSIEERDMEPGLVLESVDGTVSLDYRFKTILEGVWEKELKNVSNILFG
jgi:V/A-type H+/Na+-transporting ATPase subunit E